MEKFLKDIFDDYCENYNETASQEVQSTYGALTNALESYIAAVSEDHFIKGFRHALRMISDGDQKTINSLDCGSTAVGTAGKESA